MMKSSRLQLCGKCGGTLSAYAPEGLCAACLLESALEESSDTGDGLSGAASRAAFGDYELYEEIARGGMGVVYRARQISLNRPVAVKMILAGRLASDAEKTRFRTEAETAARLQHPGIVAVHEVGEEAGCQFFSMDFVAGRTLEDIVRERPLPMQRAARYVRAIAEAIHYAHQKGVLHRDLKPSNVLIDGNDQPRVTDFGLAKWLEGKSDLTLTGQVLGSPSFMPPEQAGGKGRHVGPCGDIYSLGALLYHLVTGRPPFVAETPAATLRMVAEAEPVPPRLLNPGVPRDLETICLKALEKDPQQRYGTAQELANELGRFLRDEPIRARPVSRPEKILRWCRRNRALAATGSAGIMLLLALGIGSPIAAYRINRESQQARKEARRSQEMARFLKQMLESAGPSSARGRDSSMMREILDKTADRIGKELEDYPAVEADLRITLGKTYSDLGLITNALEMTMEGLRLARAHIGPTNAEVATALANLGAMFYDAEDLEASERYAREALDMRLHLFGEMDTNVAMSLNNLGVTLWNRNKQQEAEQVQRRALAIRRHLLPPDHPLIAMSFLNLGNAVGARGDLAAAETNYAAAVDICSRSQSESPLAGVLMNNLGMLLGRKGELDAAAEMHQKALALRRKLYQGDHIFVVYSLTQLGIVLAARGDLDSAETNLNEAVAMLQRKKLAAHSAMADALAGLGMVSARRGNWADAKTRQRLARDIRLKSSAGENADLADSLDALGLLSVAENDLPEARRQFLEAAEIARRTQGEVYPAIIPALYHLGWVARRLDDEATADARTEQAWSLSVRQGKYGAWALLQAIYDLADVLRLRGKLADAEALLLEAADVTLNHVGGGTTLQGDAYQRLAVFYESASLQEKAIPWRTKVEELQVQLIHKEP